MKKIFLLYFLTIAMAVFSQVQTDTSYTAYSAYQKDVKKYPFIKIAVKPKSQQIQQLNDAVYKSINGRQLHYDAFFKQSKKALPAIILIHGGGWKSGNKTQMHLLAQQIALQGYACFCVGYRLSDEAKYPAGVFDIKSAIKYIKDNASQYNADPNKVAVLGCSSGGQMAALVGTTNGNVSFEDQDASKQNANVQAIIDMDGILAFHHPESEEAKAAGLWLNGSYEENPEAWQQASALTHTGKNTPPILFINSNKPRFHAGRDDMIAILDEYKIYSQVKTFDDAPHSFWFYDPWFDDIVNYSVTFLDKVFNYNKK
ncbi:alpha/beta hydrolase [Flavobacterium sp. Sd200]|uniref:alpha/beta hydrolase n=1 Tax=Flavobacterium sp. Sd200 TaxID=2692211 RepID=UPI0019256A17|nr:alpha/beta hydrolase [Flavobacterium sp. Sd200]